MPDLLSKIGASGHNPSGFERHIALKSPFSSGRFEAMSLNNHPMLTGTQFPPPKGARGIHHGASVVGVGGGGDGCGVGVGAGGAG
jgi:hypothetical protein